MGNLAPHEEVRACPWFEQQAGTDKITRRQRAIYATQGGFTSQYLAEIGVDVSNLHDDAIAAIDTLNDAVHVQAGQEIVGDDAIQAFIENAISALEGLLESFKICRHAVTDQIRDCVYQNMMSAFVGTTMGELDILSSHGYEVDPYITIDEIEIEEISATSVAVNITGEIPVTFHYGRGGDAAQVGHEFSFSMALVAPIDVPDAFEMESYSIDDSSWFGADEEGADVEGA